MMIYRVDVTLLQVDSSQDSKLENVLFRRLLPSLLQISGRYTMAIKSNIVKHGRMYFQTQ